jgi:hypothetical protein
MFSVLLPLLLAGDRGDEIGAELRIEVREGGE